MCVCLCVYIYLYIVSICVFLYKCFNLFYLHFTNFVTPPRVWQHILQLLLSKLHFKCY